MAEQQQTEQNSKPVPGKEGTVPKKRRNRKLIIGCIVIGVIAAVVITLALVISLVVVPRIETWLTDHNFIEGDGNGNGGTDTTRRTVVAEENWVIDVVNEARRGVVSIAIAEATLDPESGSVQNTSNIGTGFVIDDSGLVLTNQHVVSDAQATYVVITYDGKEHEVLDVAQDDVNDLAILQISNTDDLEALPLGDSSTLKAGQYVVAIGTPLGDLPGTVTSGIISALGRSVTASSGGFWGTQRGYEDVIQTDAAINPGNSGGPLLDADGSVIGINFATTSGADNISFAIPINQAKDRIAQYQQFGKFIKPYLGVEYQLISEYEAMYYRDVVAGAFVKRVVDDSPAAKAGIQNGDIITKIGDDVVISSFTALIQKHDVGDQVDITIWRNGETSVKEVTLEEA
jgi:S1-C subfamily serine protease